MRAAYRLAIASILLLGASEGHGQTTAIGFSISQHKDSKPKLSNAAADKIIVEINKVFASSDPPCPVKFERNQPVSTFGEETAPYSINSDADFSRLASVNAGLRIVGEINWCWQFLVGIRGCSSQPGSIWSVTRFRPRLEPLIWAHEFAHTTGSPHRSAPNALMMPELVVGNRNVDGDECQRLLNGSQAAFDVAAGQAARPEPPVKNNPPGPDATVKARTYNVEQFLDAEWPEGVPYVLASSFQRADVETAANRLRAPARQTNLVNAVALIGASGNLVDAAILLDFLSSYRHSPKDPDDAALGAVPVALGWLIGRNCKDDLALCRQLVETVIHMTQSEWWRKSLHRSDRHSDLLIGRLILKSSIALALSGSSVARIRLEQLRSASAQKAESQSPSLDLAAVGEITNQHSPAAVPLIQNVDVATKRAMSRVGGQSALDSVIKESDALSRAGSIDVYYGVK